jgi:anti-anti-sigma factor
LVGEFDLANCAEIVVNVEQLCRRGKCRVRIDLGAVTIIDAAAVGAILEARNRARALGCDIVLAAVHGLPLRVLQVLELDTLLVERDAADG